MKACDICPSTMEPDVLRGTFRCPSCGFFASDLPVAINALEGLDEVARATGLEGLRRHNFEQILDECAELIPAGRRLLDVGCAHGWFLEAAKRRGIHATGVEPDREMAARALEAGHAVVEGYFPDALPADSTYDVISFNDVLEHVPDVAALVRRMPAMLAPGGLVLVNLPVSDGAIFRLSRRAARLGLTGPLKRMWQVGLPSPHLSYFSTANLPRLFEAAGFSLVRTTALRSISPEGLYERIRSDRATGAFGAAALYPGGAARRHGARASYPRTSATSCSGKNLRRERGAGTPIPRGGRMNNVALFVAVSVCMVAGQLLFRSVGLSVRGRGIADLIPMLVLMPRFYAALVIYGIATLLWIFTLSRASLVEAYPWVIAIGVTVPLLDWLIYDQRVAPVYWMGLGFVVVGLVLTQMGTRP